MSTYAVVRVLVLLLVLLPLVSAVVVPAFGRGARRVALLLALLHLGVAAAVVAYSCVWFAQQAEYTLPRAGGLGPEQFVPEFVPGDPGGHGHSEGSDGRTTWTLFS